MKKYSISKPEHEKQANLSSLENGFSNKDNQNLVVRGVVEILGQCISKGYFFAGLKWISAVTNRFILFQENRLDGQHAEGAEDQHPL